MPANDVRDLPVGRRHRVLKVPSWRRLIKGIHLGEEVWFETVVPPGAVCVLAGVAPSDGDDADPEEHPATSAAAVKIIAHRTSHRTDDRLARVPVVRLAPRCRSVLLRGRQKRL